MNSKRSLLLEGTAYWGIVCLVTGLVVRGGPLSQTHVALKTDVFPDAPVVVVVETAGRLFMPLVGVSVEVSGCNRMDRRGCD